MAILEDLTQKLESEHTIEILPISEFKKNWNATYPNKNIKEVYQIHIYHKDLPGGFFFSKYAKHYSDIIEEVLNKYSKGKLYSGCCSEQGNDLFYDIVWNKNRTLKMA